MRGAHLGSRSSSPPAAASGSCRVLRFGPFELHEAALELRRAGRAELLRPKPLRLLLYLIDRRARVVSKRELLDAVWPEVVVSDAALWSALRDVRRTLGEDCAEPRWICTKRGGGYRFIGAVQVVSPDARDGALAAAPGEPSRPHAGPDGEASPFVGRAVELQRLVEAWQRARDGCGGVALVSGELGIGKSRMLEQLADRVRREGGCVLAGRCFEGEVALPYAPLAHAFGELDAALVRAAAGRLGRAAAPLRPLIPALSEGTPQPAEPPAPDPGAGEARAQLHEALHRLLRELAQLAPLLLVLDDLHWCDAGSLALLQRLLSSSGRVRMLVVATYREEEIGPEHMLSPLLAALGVEARSVQLRLGGLAGAELEQLVAALAPERLAAALRDRVMASSAGNPFFLRELLLQARESKRAEGGDALQLPDAVRRVLQRRLVRVSAESRRLLAFAACCSMPFSFEVVSRGCDLRTEESLTALDQALDARLIRAAAPLDHYEFAHSLIREFLSAELSPSRRLRMQRRVAAELDPGGRAAGPAPGCGVQPGAGCALLPERISSACTVRCAADSSTDPR